MPRILFFSDVDGTLLDRAGRYAMTPDELSPLSACLDIVLASSRTVLELSRNQRDLELAGPVVAENGGVVALPWHELLSGVGVREVIDARTWCVIEVGDPAAVLRDEVGAGARATGVTWVDQDDVEPGLGRRASVLLRPPAGHEWSSLEPLAGWLRARGRTVASGGDWLAVTGGADKGRGALTLIDCLARLGHTYALVAAAGDGDNDAPLLAASHRRFAIARDDGTWHPALRALPGVECVPVSGIAGWREVVRALAVPQEV